MKAIAAPVDHAPRARVVFLDLLRLIAALLMIISHTLDATLAEPLRQGATYDRWTWVRGLISVTFLVSAGLSVHLSIVSRFEQRHLGMRARVRRALRLVALGYLLHLPVGASDAHAAVRELFSVDVLQCIGVCLLGLELVVQLARTRAQVAFACAVLALAFVALAPWMAALDPVGVFRPVLTYLTPRGGSLFPLFPWAGYVFAGVALGALVLPDGARTARSTVIARLVACAAVVLAIAAGLDARLAVSFTLQKLGAVLALASALALVTCGAHRLPRAAERVASETLIVYGVHILVVYGAGVGLSSAVGPTLSLAAALAVAACMLLAMIAIALGWQHWARGGRDVAGGAALEVARARG